MEWTQQNELKVRENSENVLIESGLQLCPTVKQGQQSSRKERRLLASHVPQRQCQRTNNCRLKNPALKTKVKATVLLFYFCQGKNILCVCKTPKWRKAVKGRLGPRVLHSRPVSFHPGQGGRWQRHSASGGALPAQGFCDRSTISSGRIALNYFVGKWGQLNWSYWAYGYRSTSY